LGVDFGITDVHTDEVYAAMDWLLTRQGAIEKKLARRHMPPGGMALFDVSSVWMEGSGCELSKFGYSREGKRGLPQIEFGVLGDTQGRPVAVRVFGGNTSDSQSFVEAITTVRDEFGLAELTMVGDRGMITNARIKDLTELPGMDWVTALRAPAIAALAADDGPGQMSLFDTQNFAEITHPDYPGERLVCCRNPVLAAERGQKREVLLEVTEQHVNKIIASVQAGRLRGADRIGIAVGKVINKHNIATSSPRSPMTPSPITVTSPGSPPKPHSMASTSYGPASHRKNSIPPLSWKPTKTSPTSNATSDPSKSMTSTCGQSGTTYPTGSERISSYACSPRI
jgi:hypothetical protein